MRVLHVLAHQRLHHRPLRSPALRNTSSSCTCNVIRDLSPRFRISVINPDHRQLDQVGGRALQRSIHRGALGKAALVGVLAVDVGNRPNASEQRLHLLIAPRLLERGIDERAHSRIFFKVGIDKFPRLARLDPQLLRQPERRQPVHNPEVHDLRLRAGDQASPSAAARQTPATRSGCGCRRRAGTLPPAVCLSKNVPAAAVRSANNRPPAARVPVRR